MTARLAWRNLWRNPRRTLLTLTAMVLSVALLILILAISKGMMGDLLATTTRQYTGQAVVMAAAYRKDQDLHAVISDPASVLPRLDSDPAVTGASPRLRAWSLLSGRRRTEAAEVLGVDWERETRVTLLHRHLTAGRWPVDDAARVAVLGSGLADRLGVGTGDELVLVTQGADGSIGNEILTVEGIFRTGSPARDDSLALTGRAVLGQALALEGSAHEVALALARPDRAPASARSLAVRIAGRQPDLAVFPWQDLLPLLAQAMDLFDTSMLVTTAILYAAAGMVVLNTLLMAFHERTREFGVLQALGMTPGRVRALLAAEAAFLGGVAAAAGSALGTVASLALRGGVDASAVMEPISFGGGSMLPVIRTQLSPRDLLIPAGGMVVLSLAAVVIPALEGGRRPPAEALQRPLA